MSPKPYAASSRSRSDRSLVVAPGARPAVLAAMTLGETGVQRVAGDDAEAKETVTGLLEETGWDVADLGGIEASRWLEAMSMAWIAYGAQTGTWTHAFRLLRG